MGYSVVAFSGDEDPDIQSAERGNCEGCKKGFSRHEIGGCHKDKFFCVCDEGEIPLMNGLPVRVGTARDNLHRTVSGADIFRGSLERHVLSVTEEAVCVEYILKTPYGRPFDFQVGVSPEA